MATYATQADFEAYVEGWTTTDAAALERLLKRAERDIDQLLGSYPDRNSTTGLKLVPATDLETWEAQALSRGTCAQAEYRFAMGEDFFMKAQHTSVSGPDFSVNGRLPYIGPKVIRELDAAGLRRLAGRATAGYRSPLIERFFRTSPSWRL